MSTKDFSSKQELMIAKYLGWKVVSGSGARMHPGDVVSDEWLGECKTHVSITDHIEFKMSVWDKISKEAMSQFKRPVYFSDNGTQDLKNTWVMFEGNIHIDCEFIEFKVSTENIKFKIDSYENKSIVRIINKRGKFFICRLFTFADMFGDIC